MQQFTFEEFCATLAPQVWTQHPPVKHKQLNHDSLSQLSVDSSGTKVSPLEGFPISCLFLDSFPGVPVSLTVPIVSADSTNEETCNLLGGSLIRPSGHSSRDDAPFLPLPPCLCPSVSDQVLRRTWELAVSELPSFGRHPSCDHTRHTRNSCLQTSLIYPCLSPWRLLASLGLGNGDDLDPCTFL